MVIFDEVLPIIVLFFFCYPKDQPPWEKYLSTKIVSSNVQNACELYKENAFSTHRNKHYSISTHFHIRFSTPTYITGSQVSSKQTNNKLSEVLLVRFLYEKYPVVVNISWTFCAAMIYFNNHKKVSYYICVERHSPVRYTPSSREMIFY